MFRNAPIVSPASLAIFSVAPVSNADNGTMAIPLKTKTKIGLALDRNSPRPTGTNTSSTLSQDDSIVCLRSPKVPLALERIGRCFSSVGKPSSVDSESDWEGALDTDDCASMLLDGEAGKHKL